MAQIIKKKVMFKILESHCNLTLNEVEDENSHLQTILQLLNSVLLKRRHSVDNIPFFGPNLKSEKKKYPNMNKVNFSFSFFITGLNVTSFDCS